MSQEETKAYQRYLLGSIADNYMQRWEDLANENLTQTRQTYKQAMSYEFEGDDAVTFILDGKGESKLAIMLEDGSSPFDQKEGFRKSSKATNAGQPNWYLTIPFRIATAEALATSSIFSGQMTKTVQKIVKRDGVLTPQNMPEELKVKGIRAEIKTPEKNYPAYEHKSYQFQGLMKNKEKNQGKYVMFRRVSENSDPNSWIHKGFKPLDLMGKALNEIQIDSIYKAATNEFVTAR